MSDSLLTAFWIECADPRGPLGYGVTAFSIEDALEIVRRAGYHLSNDMSALRVKAGIRPTEIEYQYVRDHMGPIVVRGLWYSFVGVGHGS
jgi:hypothetical protein